MKPARGVHSADPRLVPAFETMVAEMRRIYGQLAAKDPAGFPLEHAGAFADRMTTRAFLDFERGVCPDGEEIMDRAIEVLAELGLVLPMDPPASNPEPKAAP